MLHAFVILSLWHAPLVTHATDASCSEAKDVRSVDVINDRYDDFFKLRRRAEARSLERDRGRGERHDITAARARDAELARREYVKHRRTRPDTESAEVAAEADRKERKRANERARSCYVARKAEAERLEGRGRHIPANAEFGLDE